jgi:hypothetical protein
MAGAVRAGCRGCWVHGTGAEGMRRFRAGRESCAARLRVPVTRVFSLYVVQAGLACPRCGQACPDSVQPGW